MAHITPSVSTNILTYRLGTRQHTVCVGSSEWWEWLQDEENTTFRFSHPMGSFTARCERLRGGWYWYAYRKRQGKLHKAYLGKGEELITEHLSDVAVILAAVSVPAEHESDIANPELDAPVPPLPPSGGAVTGHRNASLLTPKWFIPPLTSTLVARPRLIAQLTMGVRGPLTLVTAPAGWGKTCLLSAWSTDPSRSASVAWVSLDALDNDPIRFWTYVIAALNRVLAGVGETALAGLHSPQPPPIETVLTALVNALTTVSSEVVLVLDDYHIIDTQPIHQGLTYLVDHLPPQVHLVIATRSDPPLPLPRLLVRGHLTELRAADLRFTREEAAAFLTEARGLSVTTAQVEILEARTEGWIAGLCLAALAMRNRADIAAFLATFTGSNRYIVDYLIEEVLQRQPEEVQSFLLQTSILDRLSGSLCDALREMEGSQALLEQLEHANVFLIPLDEERGWYRYHHLFADALRSRFQQMHPRLIADLHCRASTWYEQQGFLEEAVNHALAATDYVRAARLIEQAAQPALAYSGTFATLLHWMEALPKDQVRAHPHLCLVYAWSLLASGTNNWEAVELWLQEALRDVPPDDRAARALAGEVAALRSMIATYQEDSVRAEELSRQALSLLPPEHWLRGLMSMSLGRASLSLGDVRAATEALTRSVLDCQAQDAWQLTLVAKSLLADAQIIQGQLRQAEVLYQDVLQCASATALPLRGPLLAHGGMGHVLCERDELNAALAHIEAGITLYQQLRGPVRTALAVYVPLARVQQAQGDPDAAHATLKHLARITDASHSAALVAALQARLHLAQGNIDAAVRWVKGSGISVDDAHAGLPQPVPREVEYLTLARLVSIQGRPDTAVSLLERLLQAATAAGRRGRVMEILVLQALMYQAGGKTAHAIAALGQALALAEPEGYIRLFTNEGMPMVALLHHAYERSIHPHYVATLLAACGEQGRRGPQRHTSSPNSFVEPLTEREREVLQLLAEGLSNQAIAQGLIVTVGTVKRHVNSIYGKLGASNRTQAAARARSFGLL